MNAAIQPKPTPRTVGQLTAELADHERLLLEAQRANSAARNALGGLIAGGDAAAIADCRRDIKLSAAKVKELTDALEFSREAIRIAKGRDQAATDAHAYRLIKERVADARKDIDALADAIVAFAIAFKKSGAALGSVDGLMRNSGVTPEVYVLTAKLLGMTQMALHLESGGILGEGRTLESPEEIRRSGRADLKRAAAEFQAVYLRHARQQLHIMREE
jgi:hypothetical protein